MAEGNAARRSPVSTWFTQSALTFEPWRTWSTGESGPLPVANLLDELMVGHVEVDEQDQPKLTPFRNAALRLGPKAHTPEIEELLQFLIRIYTYGCALPDNQRIELETLLKKVDRGTADALTDGDPEIHDHVLRTWNYVHGVGRPATCATWFHYASGFYAEPYRSWMTGDAGPLPIQELLDDLAAGDIEVISDDDRRQLAPYISAARGLGEKGRLKEVHDLLPAVSRVFVYGCAIPEEQLADLEKRMAKVDRETVEVLSSSDPWIRNFLLNVWEYVHGVTELTTYPWNISLPIADICNARCTFCTAWIDGKALVKLPQIEAFSDVIRHAVSVGLVGHGEPLAHPQFDKICELISTHLDPRATTYTITNGVYLKKWEHLLDAINLRSFSISLNAATPETHHTVMGLGENAFPGIVESLQKLCEKDENGNAKRNVSITMVLTQQNFHEIPAFIRLGEELGVTQVWLRSLLPQTNLTPGLNYHLLPAYELPNFAQLKEEAIAAITNAKVPVVADPSTWDTPVFPPQLQERIKLQPPPYVSREDALRDKDLRKRTAEVYTADSFKRRGRRLAMDRFTRVDFRDGYTRIETKSDAWQYAISAPLPRPANDAGAGHVSVNITSVSGKLGIGLWDEPNKVWVSRAGLEQDGVATLPFDEIRPGVEFVVENWSTEGRSSSGTLDAPKVFVGEEQIGEIELVKGTIYNSIDPFEDGTNPLGRTPRFACKAVYYNLYVNEMYFRVVPCCYMTHVAGFEEIRFDGSAPFLEIWNSPAMVELRRRLNAGPLLGACRKCPEKW
jgi:hypothetical protein